MKSIQRKRSNFSSERGNRFQARTKVRLGSGDSDPSAKRKIPARLCRVFRVAKNREKLWTKIASFIGRFSFYMAIKGIEKEILHKKSSQRSGIMLYYMHIRGNALAFLLTGAARSFVKAALLYKSRAKS